MTEDKELLTTIKERKRSISYRSPLNGVIDILQLSFFYCC